MPYDRDTVEELDFEKLIKPPVRWEASGYTYDHRKELRDWAWLWDPELKVWWIEDPMPESLTTAGKLPGVILTKVRANNSLR